MSENWLFDGEGVEWSDLAKAKSLQQQKQIAENLKKLRQSSRSTAPKTVEGSQCPHCGGALPSDAARKKYSACMHCGNGLKWDVSEGVLCQYCHRKNVVLQEMMGKAVFCLHCKHQFVAGGAPKSLTPLAPAVPPPVEDTQSPPDHVFLVTLIVIVVGVFLVAMMFVTAGTGR
jgi:predicted Zn-ribbon and HTH transcriptional regulator